MISKLDSCKKSLSLKSKIKCVAFAGPLLFITACGFLSSPDRKETPSRLTIEAQAAYDAGDYSKAVELLEKLVEKDPSNINGRVRLAYSYLGKSNISVFDVIKSKSTSGSTSGSNITALTSGAGLSKEKSDAIKAKESQNLLTNINSLRSSFDEFAALQKAFETICPLFPVETINKLKAQTAAIKEALNVAACKDGISTSNSDVLLAGMMTALIQVATLFPIFVPTEADGKTPKAQTQAQSYQTEISSLGSATDATQAASNLTRLNAALTGLNNLVSSVTSPTGIVNYTLAQARVISAVIVGLNLPAETKASLSSIDSTLDAALDGLGKFVNVGQTAAGSGTGGASAAKTQQALSDAKTKATDYFNKIGDNPEQKQTTCKNMYCAGLASGTPNPESYLPAECAPPPYNCTAP
ncbi:MAG: hypothetical protein ACO3A4_13245 [Silvanigrellaceae bacterium]